MQDFLIKMKPVPDTQSGADQLEAMLVNVLSNSAFNFVIADFARVGRIHTEPWRGSQYLALQRLTRPLRKLSWE